jgi:DNA-binding MarR family transcriptional regulator
VATTPARDASHEATIGLVRTATLVELVASRILQPFGLSVAQYNVLRILRGASAAGLPTLQVRSRMVTATAAITRLMDKLIGAGLVERLEGDDDRRQRLCRITTAGLAILERLDPLIAELDAIPGRALGASELEQLNGFLERIATHIRATHC